MTAQFCYTRTFLVSVLVGATGCSSSSGGAGGGGNFCNALEAAPSCAGSLSICQNQLAIDDLDYAHCRDDRSAFLGCLASQTLICESSSTVYAGATENSGAYRSLGDYGVWYPDACILQADAWTNCRNCPAALEALAAYDVAEGNDRAIARCASRRAAFMECVLSASPRHCGETDVLRAGVADGQPPRELDLGSLQVFTNEQCGAVYDEWIGCHFCGQGLGYGKQGLDVGQPCQSSSECANGLQCEFSMCTAPCNSDSDYEKCGGRVWRNDRCENDQGQRTTCSRIVDACVVECESNDDCAAYREDGFCPGNGAILSAPDGFVEYGVCFFGPCGQGWDGCTAERPFP